MTQIDISPILLLIVTALVSGFILIIKHKNMESRVKLPKGQIDQYGTSAVNN